MLRVLDLNEKEGIAPVRVARTIVRAIEPDEPDPEYAVGSNASTIFALRRAPPSRSSRGSSPESSASHPSLSNGPDATVATIAA